MQRTRVPPAAARTHYSRKNLQSEKVVSGQVTVFFRFDDFSETSPLAVEAGLVDALRSHQFCATFAVIPAVTEGSYHQPGDRGILPLGPEKARFLRRAVEDGAVDVALHGWNHRTVATKAPHSEFVGLASDDQVAKITQGQELLRRSIDVDARVFVPPWNSYDDATLDALVGRGITCMSANRYGPCRGDALRFVPTTADMGELRQAIARAKNSGDADPIIGVLLHPYDFKESGDARGTMTCETFAAELLWLTQEPGVRVVPISRLSAENHTLGATRYRANQPLRFEQVSPPSVPTTRATPFYRSEAGARRTRVLRALATLGTYIGAVVAGFAVHRFVGKGLEAQALQVVDFGPYVMGALLLALLARIAVKREVHFRTMLAFALLSGMMMAGWWSNSGTQEPSGDVAGSAQNSVGQDRPRGDAKS